MIYQVTGLSLAALIGLGALGGVASMALVKALWEHLASPSRPYPRSPVRYQAAAEKHLSERLGRRV